MMDPIYEIELEDCPFCGGAGLLEEEQGWCWYAMCMRAAGACMWSVRIAAHIPLIRHLKEKTGGCRRRRPQRSSGMWARSSDPAWVTKQCGSQRRPIPCRTAAC